MSAKRRPAKGQAMTELILLVPMFMVFLVAFAKIFAMLILVQKLEIASYYAARRWQLQSHRNVAYTGAGNYDGDAGDTPCGYGLCGSILEKVSDYLGYNSPGVRDFLGLDGNRAELKVVRTQVWNIVTLTVKVKPILGFTLRSSDNPNGLAQGAFGAPFQRSATTFSVTKYVPNRDRPIAFVLPGLN